MIFVAALMDVITIIGTNLIHMSWDDNVFRRDSDELWYIHMFDLWENTSRNQELNIYIVQSWMM